MQLSIISLKNKKEVKNMKKEVIKKIFQNAKSKLASAEMIEISKSFKEQGRKPRDFIGVETLSQAFEEMAKERSGKTN